MNPERPYLNPDPENNPDQSYLPDFDPARPVLLAPLVRKKNGRVSGRMYDAHTHGDMGYASEQQRAQYRAGMHYTRTVGGVKQDFFIEP